MWRAPESRPKSSHNISRQPVDPEYREKLKNFIEKKEERERANWSRLSRSLESGKGPPQGVSPYLCKTDISSPLIRPCIETMNVVRKGLF